MSLTEETSSVDEVQWVLKQQLGFEVILLDANTSSTDESFFGQRQGAPGTFLQFRQTATRPPYERFLPRL